MLTIPMPEVGRNLLPNAADARGTGADALLDTPAILSEPKAEEDRWAEAFAVKGRSCASLARPPLKVVEEVETNGSAGSSVIGPTWWERPRRSSGPKVGLIRIASILPLSVRKKRLSITNDAMVRNYLSYSIYVGSYC